MQMKVKWGRLVDGRVSPSSRWLYQETAVKAVRDEIAQARSFCAAIKIVYPKVPVSQYPVLKRKVEAENM